MPMFRVTLQKWGPAPTGRNPFLANIGALRSTVRERVWELKAKDEADVRRLYREACDLGIRQVIGFELARIERLAPSAPGREETK